MRLTFDQIQALFDEGTFEGFVEISELEDKSIAVQNFDSNYDKLDQFTVKVNGEIIR